MLKLHLLKVLFGTNLVSAASTAKHQKAPYLMPNKNTFGAIEVLI